jgi:alpha-L-rhamnosidase
VWSSGYLRLLWDCYRFYADKQLLLDHYDSMVHFFHHLESRSKGDIIPTESADAKGGAGKYMNAQEPESVLTAFYYLDAMLMAKMAGVTGHKNDSVQFSTKAERIRTAYNTRFFHSEKNLYGIGSQTENALPLYLGMVPENKAELVLNSLEKQIAVSDSFRLTAGIHGTKLLLAALSQFGKEETAFQLVNKNGGLKLTDGIKGSNTTNKIPTNNGPNNQSLVGSFDSWFYKSLAGIEPSDQYPAFGKTTIRPFFAKGLNRVDCSLQTIRGKLSSGWIRHGNVVILKIEIPFNCKSEIWIPVDQNTRISESGKPIETASDISLVKKLKDYRVYEIGSGEYVFEIKYPVDRF